MWRDSGEYCDPMTRMAGAAPVRSSPRRATKAARIVSPSRGVVAISCRSRSRGTTITSPAVDDPGRHEDPEPAQHVQLAEEATGSVVGDEPLVAVDGHHDVDPGAHQDEEVVGDVALPEEVLPGL